MPYLPQSMPSIQSAAPMPEAPMGPSPIMPTPAMPAPPTFGGAPPAPIGPPPQAGGMQPPNLLQSIMPMITAFVAGQRDPVAIGAGMAAFQRGRRLKQAETEQQHERDAREQKERAEFYSRMIQNGQQFDDPIAFEQWKTAIKPMAELYQVPIETLQFPDAKRKAAAEKSARAAIDSLRKVHGDVVDDPEWQAQHSATVDGKPVKVDQLYRMANVPAVTDAAGAAVAPVKAPKANPVEAGSFEDFSQTTDPAKRAQILADRKAYQQVDDRPARVAGAGGPTDYQQFNMSERLASAWTKANAPVKEMDRQLRIMKAGMDRFRKGDKNGGSQAVLVTFQKILDPTSVVRESEYARTTEGQALLDRIEGYATRLAQGGTTLTDAEMAAMLETAQQMFNGMGDWQAGTRRRIETQAKKNGVDPATVFDDVLMGDDSVAPPAPTGAPVGRFNPATGKVEPIK